MENGVLAANGFESCWTFADQTPKASSEHIIVYEEAHALLSVTKRQTLKGPVGPPGGLLSDSLEKWTPVFTLLTLWD